MASLYKSKFVERRDAADIIADYRRVTGEEPTTFERFVGYLRKAKDPHTYDQRSHLKRLRYHPIPLGRLHQEMSQLIGAEAAEPFQHKVNQSSGDVRISPAARAAIERRYARDCRLLASLS